MSVSVIITVKIDNAARLKNLKTISHYYFKSLPDAEFIFVEERDSNAKYNLIDYLPTDEKYDKIIITNMIPDKEPIYKTANYNQGAKVAKYNTLLFLDVDVIVDTTLLVSEISELISKNELGVHVGYTGTSLYMTPKGEKDFLQSLNISDLYNKWKQKYNLYMGLYTEDFACMNINSVGGCLIMSKDAFLNTNGFNPNYRGWGYEDNEIVTRAHNLKQNVTKSNNKENILYHLPHNLENKNPSQHSFYDSNHAESTKVDSMPYEQLKEYVKSW